MRRSFVAVSAFLVAACLVVPGANTASEEDQVLPAAQDILERYIDALGGRGAIEGLKTRVCLGRLVNDLHYKRPPYEVVPVVGYAAVPGQVLMVEHKSDGVRCEGSDGDVTWVRDTDGARLAEEPMTSKIAWLLDPHGALRMEEYFPGLEVTSKETLDGRVVYVMEPAELDRAHYALHFDAETGLLVRVGYYWEMKDYREIDGVRVPFRIDMSRKGGSTSMVLDLVKHNLPLDTQLFTAPGPASESGE